MPVKEPLVIRRVTSGALEYTAVEESLEIKQICVANPSSFTDEITIEIQDTTMAVIPAGLLPYTLIDINNDLFGLIRSKYSDFPTFKVMNGRKLTITSTGTFDVLEVRYRTLDPGDITPETAGTDKSEIKPIINTFYNSQSISASGDFEIDAVYGEPSIGKYPFLERVPAGRTLTIYGMAVYNPKAVGTKVTHIKIWKEETVLFTPNKDGFIVDPDIANALGNTTTVTLNAGSIQECKFMLFDTPITLDEQDKLTLNYTVSYDGTNALPAKSLLVTIFGVLKPKS